ncbi:MAG: M20 family metallo-hydrolase [Treponema sp.]|nr:M20 family metallo-hydrolase [Treponema sp.]
MTDIKKFMNENRALAIELEKLLTSTIAMAPQNGGDGESKKCAVLKEWLSNHGFEKLEQYDAPDSRVTSGVRPNLVATIKGKSDDLTVWSIAHLDVVPTGDLKLWNTNPWECVEKDGVLYGRGVEDNQQGLVSGVMAALYYIQNKITPEHTIKLLFAADEECGSDMGMVWLLKNTKLFRKQDLILIPDGGDPKGETIEIAEKNLMWLRVHVIGKQTHGSRPDNGANACLAASELALKINGLEKVFDKRDFLFEPPYSTFQPTMRLKNVDGINIIPGEDVSCFDCRILPCYTLKEVTEKVDEICDEIGKKYGVKVEYEIPQKSESPASPKDAPVVQKLAEALKKVHGIDAKCIGIGGGTVAAELRREGIDAAVWSTLDDQAHQPNEYCKVDNLLADAMTLVELFR